MRLHFDSAVIIRRRRLAAFLSLAAASFFVLLTFLASSSNAELEVLRAGQQLAFMRELLSSSSSAVLQQRSSRLLASNDSSIEAEINALPDYLQKILRMIEADVDNIIDRLGGPCGDDLKTILEAIPQVEKNPTNNWPLKFIDASGKPGSSILLGNMQILGSLTECLDIVSNVTPGQNQVEPQYCSGFLGQRPNSSAGNIAELGNVAVGLNIGLCIPYSCTPQDVDNLFNAVLSRTIDRLPIKRLQNIELLRTNCSSNHDSIVWDASSIVAVIILAVTGLMLFLGTVVDALLQYAARFRAEQQARINGGGPQSIVDYQKNFEQNQPGIVRLLLCWSVTRNGGKILAVETHKSARSDVAPLHSVHGIRFISMCWVIYTHTYVFCIMAYKDALRFSDAVGAWWFQPIANASFSVDTFFFLSGMLLAYVVTGQAEQRKRINWIQYYVHRYWRLTPVYILTLVCAAGLLKFMGRGPFWNIETYFPNQCKTTWWTNVLYINNFSHVFDGCMQWAWYLSNDMQFYVFSPLLIIPFIYRRWMGMIVWMLMLCGFFAATISVTVVYQLPVNLATAMRSMATARDVSGFWNYFNLYYVKPWTRVGPYLLGIAFGYILHQAKTRQWRMKPWQAAIGWPVTVACSAAIIFSLRNETAGISKIGPVAASIYNIFSRPAWGALVGFVVLACESGAGGFATTILTFPGFVPLSRLAYCAYLIHPILMLWVYGNLSNQIGFEHLTMNFWAFGFIFASFGAAFILSLMFEAPALALEKLATTALMRTGGSKRVVAITPPAPPQLAREPPGAVRIVRANALPPSDSAAYYGDARDTQRSTEPIVVIENREHAIN